jgi:multidrug efflux pump
MNFTDIFVKRPVLSIVVSLMILVVGLRAALSLPVLQYPRTENAVVTVTTAYFGADPEVVAGFITTPLEAAVAQAAGIEYLTSSSAAGLSTITARLQLNYDYNAAMSEISSRIDAVRDRLPPQSQQPVITVQVGQNVASMYIGFFSDALDSNQITDYLLRVVQPQLQAIPGVKLAEIFGARYFALRAWLDPQRLAAYELTAADINRALAANDFISSLGNTRGQMVQVNLNASTSLHSLEEFRNLVVKQTGSAVVRLSDVAEVSLGAEDYGSEIRYNGENAIVIAVHIAPDASLLDVGARVDALFPRIQEQLPEGFEGNLVFNAANFVNASIDEVARTIGEALIIVVLVVFAFLGSIRSVAIPVVAIPLSLIGAFIMMLALGYSINLLTLLAMVLAIGLVVDDAIIVVENVTRYINQGMRPFQAALVAARELTGPIIAMLAVLVAVYVPIAFQGGLTGALFTEFAFTLVGTILVSTVVALTLSPMMCAHLLNAHGEETEGWQRRVSGFVDRNFERLQTGYRTRLSHSLDTKTLTIIFTALVFVGIYALWNSPFMGRELAPQEDQGFIFVGGQGASNATPEQTLIYADATYEALRDDPAIEGIFQAVFQGQFFNGLVLKTWGEREASSAQVAREATEDLRQVVGLNLGAFPLPPLPGPDGFPVEFIITTTESFDRLFEVAQTFYQEVQQSEIFYFSQLTLRIDRPQATVEIDRDKAALLGLTMADIGDALTAMLSGGYVGYFSLDGRSYRVMAQADQPYRLNPNQLLNYYIRAGDGTLVPLSTVATITTRTIPQSLPRFQQQNAATIGGVSPLSQGDVLAALNEIAERVLPDGYGVDYAGQSRQYTQESSGFAWVLLFSLVMIFLVLAALYESFRDPLIILMSVPTAIAGALIAIYLVGSLRALWPDVMQLGGGTLNIYTQVGLVTLVGLIAKHGILIVDVANRLQREGHSKREAVEEASAIRLRPILMTAAATVLGVTPLLLATGAGAAARFSMGLVVASGMTVGTLFTLFVVPAFYLLVARDHSRNAQAPAGAQLQGAE